MIAASNLSSEGTFRFLAGPFEEQFDQEHLIQVGE